MSIYLDLHAIHTLPASNINRDRDGAPKSGVYGGVRRHQVSSQSWKRAIRTWMGEHGLDSTISSRSLIRVAAELLAERSGEELSQRHIDQITGVAILAGVAGKESIGNQRSKAIDAVAKPETEDVDAESDVETIGEIVVHKTDSSIQFSEETIEQVIDLAVEIGDPALAITSKKTKGKSATTVVKGKHVTAEHERAAIAIFERATVASALFGAMFASKANLNVDAAAQVAFALGVGESAQQFDFYTAIDQLATGSGASMMGTKLYDASTLYRYANLNFDVLAENLGEDRAASVPEIVAGFAQAFIESMPTGSQNGYAARTLPSAVVAVISTSPANHAAAYLDPIEGGELREATRRLRRAIETRAERIQNPIAVLAISPDGLADDELGEQCPTLDAMIGEIQRIAGDAR